MSRTNLSKEETEVLQNGFGNLYKLPDAIVGNIIEYLNSSEVKDLRYISRPMRIFVENEDTDTKNLNRPKHANLYLLNYKMLDTFRIDKIIEDSPFKFPPNCYYLETASSQNDKLFTYIQFIIQAESVKMDELKKNDARDKRITFKYFYYNSKNTIQEYNKEGKNDMSIIMKSLYVNIDHYDMNDAINKFKHMENIFINFLNENYIFEIQYNTTVYPPNVRKIRYGLKKIS